MNLTNVLVLVVLLPGSIHAQPVGRILGTVRDASTKQLLEMQELIRILLLEKKHPGCRVFWRQQTGVRHCYFTADKYSS